MTADLILLDILLPDLDGFIPTRNLEAPAFHYREENTGHFHDGAFRRRDPAHRRDAQCADDFFTKPLDLRYRWLGKTDR